MTTHDTHSNGDATQGVSLKGCRVLIGPADTASFPSRMARGLAEHGAKCWILNLSPHLYNADSSTFGKAKLWAPRWVGMIRYLENRGLAGRIAGGMLKEIMRLFTFVWSLWAVNVVVFVSSRSVFRSNIDLWIYKLLGKRVIRIFLGSDSRPRFMSGWHHKLLDAKTRTAAAAKLARRVRRQHKRVSRLSKWSSVVVDNPLCGHFQTKPCVNFFMVGFPHDESVYGKKPIEISDTPGRNLRVLHCPSNPKVKGTERIDAAINKLIADGAPIDYTRITGMPRSQVLEHLSDCDLVIDQMYSDSPMAGFASEAAAFGKPSVVCGYPWDLLRTYLPTDMFPPNWLATPEEFDAVLPQAISDADQRREIGEQAYQFINSRWHQDAVVERFAKIIAGDDEVPSDWWFDPAGIEYWQGLGATQDHRKQVLIAFCLEQGIGATMAPANSPFVKTVQGWLDEPNE